MLYMIKLLFKKDIKSRYLWPTFGESDDRDPELLWDTMINIITEVADIHCPLRNMKFRDDSPEWITKDMVQEIAYKDYLYREAKVSQYQED